MIDSGNSPETLAGVAVLPAQIPAVPQSSGAEVLLNPLPLRHSYHDNNI